jgi:hypothetical protein
MTEPLLNPPFSSCGIDSRLSAFRFGRMVTTIGVAIGQHLCGSVRHDGCVRLAGTVDTHLTSQVCVQEQHWGWIQYLCEQNLAAMAMKRDERLD